MQFKEIAIQPLTHQIHSHKRQDMPVWLAISELVDNSLDANARVVEVKFNKEHKSVLIKDDGAGAPAAHLRPVPIARHYNLRSITLVRIIIFIIII